ncbi:ABC transporter permease [Anaeromicropila herbilytica]|uniref:Transport permease protein n=1 Tax=Anaeromicropila herbilytica TaxID=2785025 RepID=A0A7R7EIV3_9FIRM|nr:ABC transporter permease [Anaeromicropila herbilytica]BCN29491.1 transport permease protein [Anaeromicropila herbilytica]
MNGSYHMFTFDFKRRIKSSFTYGYHLIFPVIMILLLGLLLSGQFGERLSSFQYYALVMLPFCTTLAMITSAYAGKDEAYQKTAYRFLIAPIKEKDIVIAKILSCTISFGMCNILVLVISWIIFSIPMGSSVLEIILLLVSETFCVCAIGIYIGLGMKNFIILKNFLNIPIFICAIIGGSFYPIGTSNSVLEVVFHLSPLTWVNRSIFLCIYDNHSEILWITSFILLAIGGLFTFAGVRSFQKEEFLHGDLLRIQK